MSLQNYFDGFGSAVRGGDLCGGKGCHGWFLSDVDTWHECSCNRRHAVLAPHPEDDHGDCASSDDPEFALDAEDAERARAAEEENDARFLSRDLPF